MTCSLASVVDRFMKHSHQLERTNELLLLFGAVKINFENEQKRKETETKEQKLGDEKTEKE